MVGRQDPTYNWSCQRKPKRWNSTNIYNSGKLLKYYLNICTWLRKGRFPLCFSWQFSLFFCWMFFQYLSLTSSTLYNTIYLHSLLNISLDWVPSHFTGVILGPPFILLLLDPVSRHYIIFFSWFTFLFWWSESSRWESVNGKKIFWELVCLKMPVLLSPWPHNWRENSFKLLKTVPHWSLVSNVFVEYYPQPFGYLVNFTIFSLWLVS